MANNNDVNISLKFDVKDLKKGMASISDSFEKLQKSVSSVGKSFSSVEKALSNVTKSMGDATKGASSTAKANNTLKKSEESVTQATNTKKKAFEGLEKTTRTLNNTMSNTSQTAQKYSTTITKIGANASQVKGRISEVSSVSQRLTTNLSSLASSSNKAGTALKKAGDSTKQFKQNTEQATTSSSKLSQVLGRFGGIGTTISSAFSRVKTSISNAFSGLKSSISNMNGVKGAAQGVSGTMSSLAGTVKGVGTAIAGAFVVKKVVDFGVAVANVGVAFNAMKETSQVTWTTLLGSQEKAIEQLERIEHFAKTTPFSQSGVDMMAKYLHNAGYEGEALFETLTNLGNMGSAYGMSEATLTELVRQFSQVQQATVAYTEDLNILQDRGVPIFKALAETMGISVADVKKYAGEGKVTAEVYNKALQSIYKKTEGAMEDQSKTFSGLMSTMKDNLKILSGTMTEKLFAGLKDGLATILPLVESFNTALKESGSFVEAFRAIGVELGWLKELFVVFGTVLKGQFDELIAPAIANFKQLFGETMTAISENLAPIMAGFENFGKLVYQIYEEFVKPVLTTFLDYIAYLWDAFNQCIPGLTVLWETLSSVFLTVWDTVLSPVLTFLIDTIKKLLDTAKQHFPKMAEIFNSACGIINRVWNEILKPVFNKIKEVLEKYVFPAFKWVFDKIGPVVSKAFNKISDLWHNTLAPVLNGIIDFISGVFTGNWKKAWNGVKNVLSGIFNGMISVVKKPLNAIIGMVNKAIGGLNKIQFPSWVPGVGGKGLNIPKIPMLWKGTAFAKGGLTLVGEQGPELVNMSRGATVYPAHKTKSILSSIGQGIQPQNAQQKTANVIVELDGRTIARAIGQPLLDTLHVSTGLSF